MSCVDGQIAGDVDILCSLPNHHNANLGTSVALVLLKIKHMYLVTLISRELLFILFFLRRWGQAGCSRMHRDVPAFASLSPGIKDMCLRI